MNRTVRRIVAAVVCGSALSFGACDTAHPPAPEPPTPAEAQENPLPAPEQIARNLISACAAGDWPAATAAFGTKMKETMTETKMQEWWVQLTAGKGNFTEVSDVTMSTLNENDLAVVTCAFEQGTQVVQVTIDPRGMIADLHLR